MDAASLLKRRIYAETATIVTIPGAQVRELLEDALKYRLLLGLQDDPEATDDRMNDHVARLLEGNEDAFQRPEAVTRDFRPLLDK